MSQSWSAAFSSSEHAWATPPGVVGALETLLGLRFVLDACALEHSAQADYYIAPLGAPATDRVVGLDALTSSWSILDYGRRAGVLPDDRQRALIQRHACHGVGRSGLAIWCNPPYGRAIGAWLAKARAECEATGCPVVVLTFARTDTVWWHEHAMMAATQVFIRGRIAFEAPPWMEAPPRPVSAPAPSAALLYRPGGGEWSPRVLGLELTGTQRGR